MLCGERGCLLAVRRAGHELDAVQQTEQQKASINQLLGLVYVLLALAAVIGIIIGTGLGAALASSLRLGGVTNIAIPLPSLIAFVILSALLGLLAATWPARRAANLDVLAAIAAE